VYRQALEHLEILEFLLVLEPPFVLGHPVIPALQLRLEGLVHLVNHQVLEDL